MAEKKRVFVGVPFTDEARRGVERILKFLKRKHWPVRWEKLEKLHITLAFLRWISGEEVAKVAQVVKVVQKLAPFEVRFKGLGGFPDLELPRVIWVGLKGDLKSLARVYKQVRGELGKLGFEFESRPFVAHVTLGRVEKGVKAKMRREIGKQIAKLRKLDIPQKLEIDKVVVYESKLRREGSEYKIIDEIRFRI